MIVDISCSCNLGNLSFEELLSKRKSLYLDKAIEASFFSLCIISSFFKMDKTLVTTVKVTKESQTVLDWYVVSVSTEQNFSQIFEAISAASNHALNNTCLTEKTENR
jgi:hypothetical protein